MVMKFKIGDAVKVIKSGNESFLKHFLKIGTHVKITGYSDLYKNYKAYNVENYSEPLLEEELEIIK